MNNSRSITDLAALTGAPRDVFGAAVFERYAERLVRLAERRIGRRLQAKVSAEDIVQSAFKSFFRRLPKFRFQAEGTDPLWGLLIVITLRKCARWDELFQTDKRSVDREIPHLSPQSNGGKRWDVASPEPGPEDAAVFTEMLERLLSSLTPRNQQMVLLRLQGFELDEIAREAKSSRRTVARVLAEARRNAQDLWN